MAKQLRECGWWVREWVEGKCSLLNVRCLRRGNHPERPFREGSESSCLVTGCLRFGFLNPRKGIQWPVKEMPKWLFWLPFKGQAIVHKRFSQLTSNSVEIKERAISHMKSEQHIGCRTSSWSGTGLKMRKNTLEARKRTHKRSGQDVRIVNPCLEHVSLVLCAL